MYSMPFELPIFFWNMWLCPLQCWWRFMFVSWQILSQYKQSVLRLLSFVQVFLACFHFWWSVLCVSQNAVLAAGAQASSKECLSGVSLPCCCDSHCITAPFIQVKDITNSQDPSEKIFSHGHCCTDTETEKCIVPVSFFFTQRFLCKWNLPKKKYWMLLKILYLVYSPASYAANPCILKNMHESANKHHNVCICVLYDDPELLTLLNCVSERIR